MTRLCPGGELADALAPYRALCDQVDRLTARITTAFPDQITCQAACAGCCTLQGVLPVEAASLALAWRELPGPAAVALRTRLNSALDDGPCPLLSDDHCPLYPARPIICRTHGLPILVDAAGGKQLDHCPRNFTGTDTLPGTAVIDLERLNLALVAANRHFLACCFPAGGLPDRIPLRRILSFPATV